ncbi:hypothetical protein M514_12822 [Trichuris suis]|uniref:Uncharacterized protein n=1 Tax=Trichuris suis TaxID=68888 RepID=A0A085LMW8_9BILA|nr:hypothetical protein M513_12822 [Trichuris suis]KFD72828.1 hypothetical protein M514_12822 [Trichuris suis]
MPDAAANSAEQQMEITEARHDLSQNQDELKLHGQSPGQTRSDNRPSRTRNDPGPQNLVGAGGKSRSVIIA